MREADYVAFHVIYWWPPLADVAVTLVVVAKILFATVERAWCARLQYPAR